MTRGTNGNLATIPLRVFALVGLAMFVVGVAGLAVFHQRSFTNPFSGASALDYPQFSSSDDQGRLYIVDDSLRRVTVADGQGNIISQLHGGSRATGDFFYADQIIPGGQDSFFLLNYVLDSNGMFLIREQLLEYSVSGKLLRVFYQREYDGRKAELVQRGQIYSPKILRNYLYFFLLDDTKIQYIRKSLNRETTEILGETYFPDANAYATDLEWVDSEHFLFLDKRGYLIRGDIYGQLQRIELSGQEISGDETFQTSEDTESSDEAPTSDLLDYYEPQVPKFNFWDMSISDSGTVYVSDPVNRRIVGIDLDQLMAEQTFHTRFTSVFDRNIAMEQGYSDEPFIYYRIGAAPGGFSVSYDYGVYTIQDGQVTSHFEALNTPTSWSLASFLWWMSFVFTVASSLALVLLFYTQVMKRRISLVVKQLLIIVPLLAGGIFLISTILLQNFIREYKLSNINNILALTQTISLSIDGDRFHSIRNIEDYMNDDYKLLRNTLRRALNYNLDTWNEGLYFALYQVIDETLYGFMYQNNRIGMRHPFNWYDDPQSAYRQANEGDVVFEEVQDISGNWLYGIGPIYDSHNEVVGLLEIGTDLYSFNQNARRLYNQTMALMSGIGLMIVVFITIMTVMILRSLSILRKGVERIAEGDWNYQIKLRSNDEVSELGQQFNHMSASINNYLQQIRVMNDSYQKFFPDQFLKYLELQSLTEVKLGDQVKRKMTIMFSDIRSFTSISEQMTPEENFDFLNGYLNLVGPIIRNSHGFIDKYIGDAIMALFPDNAGDAVDAAINMLMDLREYNRNQVPLGKPEISVGIGIHTGDLMLGILGERERMQGTVIADSVNFASRLETLSKQMGASLLISGTTLDGIESSDGYLKRYMGRIRVLGKTDAVPVYELLNGLSEEEIEAKLRSKAQLSEAIAAFEAGKLEDARNVFQSLEKEAVNSSISHLYLSNIETELTLRRDAVQGDKKPSQWEGILISDTK